MKEGKKMNEKKLREKIVKLRKEKKELEKTINRQRKLIDINFLTGLFNRQAFYKFFKNTYKEIRLASQYENQRAQKSQSSLLLIDLDEFKKYNDQFGHQFGDIILKKVAKSLKGSVRNIDLVFRWGGDEFAIILMGTDINQAEKIAKIILTEVKKIKVKGRKIFLSVSIGVSQFQPELSSTQIFKKADQALLKAKEEGRDKVVVG